MTDETDQKSSQDTAGPSPKERAPSMGRDVMTVAIVSIVALMLGLNLFLLFDDGGDVEGAKAPQFELPVMESDETKALADYRGRVVVMDFWASWCTACLEQAPSVQKVADDPTLADEVKVLSINVDIATEEREEDIRQFKGEADKRLPTLMDDGSVQKMYGATTLPTVVVVDAGGTVVDISQKVHDEQTLRDLIGRAQ